MNIGTYPEFTLAEARDVRNGLARDVVRGINPKAALEPEPEKADLLLRPFAERYYREVVEVDMKHPEQTWAWLDKDILPHLGELSLKEITSAQMRAVIDIKKNAGYSSAALVLRNILKRLYDYAYELELVDSNPAMMIKSTRCLISAPRWLEHKHSR